MRMAASKGWGSAAADASCRERAEARGCARQRHRACHPRSTLERGGHTAGSQLRLISALQAHSTMVPFCRAAAHVRRCRLNQEARRLRARLCEWCTKDARCKRGPASRLRDAAGRLHAGGAPPEPLLRGRRREQQRRGAGRRVESRRRCQEEGCGGWRRRPAGALRRRRRTDRCCGNGSTNEHACTDRCVQVRLFLLAFHSARSVVLPKLDRPRPAYVEHRVSVSVANSAIHSVDRRAQLALERAEVVAVATPGALPCWVTELIKAHWILGVWAQRFGPNVWARPQPAPGDL